MRQDSERNEKAVSEAAREAYGVELTDESSVDDTATAARRSERYDDAHGQRR